MHVRTNLLKSQAIAEHGNVALNTRSPGGSLFGFAFVQRVVPEHLVARVVRKFV